MKFYRIRLFKRGKNEHTECDKNLGSVSLKDDAFESNESLLKALLDEYVLLDDGYDLVVSDKYIDILDKIKDKPFIYLELILEVKDFNEVLKEISED